MLAMRVKLRRAGRCSKESRAAREGSKGWDKRRAWSVEVKLAGTKV